MTDRELRLRQRIDTLRDQRDHARQTLKTAIIAGRIRLPHGCIYCGHGPSIGSPRTCSSHHDLPDLDPHYQMRAPHAKPTKEAA